MKTKPGRNPFSSKPIDHLKARHESYHKQLALLDIFETPSFYKYLLI
jgi:hypothetical protein